MKKQPKMVEIQLTIPDDELLVLFIEAHKLDVTFNEFVQKVIEDHLAALEAREGYAAIP